MAGEIALMIPIVGTIGFFTVVALIVFWAIKAREKKSHFEHDQRMLAIDKGAEIPMYPIKEKNPYIWPFIWIGIGLAMLIALALTGDEDWPWGMLPLFIGAGMIAARLLFKKQKSEEQSSRPSAGYLPKVEPKPSPGVQDVKTLQLHHAFIC